MSGGETNPFSPRAVLGLVLFGALVFIALLWMMGSGMMAGSSNDGGGHAGGKGLNGYAALAAFMEKRGYTVRRSRTEAALDDPGLLVLTPEQFSDGKDIARIVEKRRFTGPTLIVTPKWRAMAMPPTAKGAQKGWVSLAGPMPPNWPGFLDDVTIDIGPMRAGGGTARWRGAGFAGELPVSEVVLSGKGRRLVPLVRGDQDGRILAAYVNDGGMHPALENLAIDGPGALGDDEDVHPLVIVFEPDLLDNYGFADAANARLADRLVRAAAGDSGQTITFDLTLNGLGRSANLLTLAFTPPFLAATLCLIIAALVVGWRAFMRFGPPRREGRDIAFGKRALVANSAGLIRRTGRLHLVAAPYTERARERLAKALALPRQADAGQTDAAIDRALAVRQPGSPPFSLIAARLRSASRVQDILKAAQELHALERTLHR